MSIDRILCLDLGAKRIGVAISDPLGITAQPLQTIEWKDSSELLDKIKKLCQSYPVQEVVVGWPLDPSGRPGHAVRRTRQMLRIIAPVLKHCHIRLWDERLSTSQAERILIQGNVRRKRRKHVVDAVAASIILQAYLEAHSHSIT